LAISKTASNGVSTPRGHQAGGGAMRPSFEISGTAGANLASEAPSGPQGGHDELAALAEQQAALRRVATLVARGAGPSEVLFAVAEEMARCLKVANVELCRYQDSGTRIVVGGYAEPGEPHLALGESRTCEGENLSATVWHTGRPARMDSYERAHGNIAARMRDLGIRSRVGAPIIVDGRVWGMAVVGTRRP
jgi:GAF domain-containing protein